MLQIKVRTGWEIPIVFLTVIAIGLSSAFYLYFVVDKYSLLYYWDAVSHSVAARKLVDWGENPGIGQIGTVWLPLPHFLLLPFTLVDMLFMTGFAGTALSLTCMAIASVFIYKIVEKQGQMYFGIASSFVPFLGALLFATNPNILYLGVTAMTEAPFLAFFVASLYYLQKWLQFGNRIRDLLLCAILLSLATLSRYEAWFVPVFLIGAASLSAFRGTERNRRVVSVLASIVSLSGVLFWLAWNQYNYGDPLEFANAEYYSASWYAQNRPFRDLLFLQPASVMSIYGTTALVVYGPLMLAAGAMGYFLVYRMGRIKGKNGLLLFLGLPALFTIISLLAGIGEMSYWFNARFMVLLSPLIILMTCIWLMKITKLTSNRALVASTIVLVFIWQLASPVFIGVPTFSDAIGGYSVKENLLAVEAGEALKSLYDGNGKIMVLAGSGLEHRIMVTSGIPLRQFDEIIEHSTWKASFKEPWSFDRWLVITIKPGTDAETTTKYWLDRQDQLDIHYRLEYQNEYYKIMALR